MKLDRLSGPDKSPLAFTLFDAAPIYLRMLLTHVCHSLGVLMVRYFPGSHDPIRIVAIPRLALTQDNGAPLGKPNLMGEIYKKILSSFHLFLPLEAAQ